MMRRARNSLRAIRRSTPWRVITTWLQTMVYLCLAGAGITALMDPPRTFIDAMGYDLTFFWGGFLTLGGLAAAASCPRGWWFLERIALVPAIGGTVLYLAIILTQHFTTSGNRLPQACIVLAITLTLVIRMIATWKFWQDPWKFDTAKLRTAKP